MLSAAEKHNFKTHKTFDVLRCVLNKNIFLVKIYYTIVIFSFKLL